ncbi:unnamed protein product [Parnassius apollo]|uniref:(apollo) hypothetical protein n=1 Tax=Parnassius apollo TaxID=110799 RepID=A0A8S3XEK3_PARAO|nr:unnamed protein product [Parnassius apollo]
MNVFSYYRVTRVQFYDLLSLIIGDITKQDTNYRKDITQKERLAICLRFLATGDSFITTEYNYRVVVDANKRFIIIDVGSMGRFSDGGIFADSTFGYKLQNGHLNLPNHKPLTPDGDPTPFVFIGYQAFPLQKHFMRPYPRSV